MNEETFRVELMTSFNEAGVINEFKNLIKKVDGEAANKLKETIKDMQNTTSDGEGGNVLRGGSSNDSGGLINDLMEEIRNTNDAIKETNSVEELAELNRHQANLEKQLKDLKNLGMQSEDANNDSKGVFGFFREIRRSLRGLFVVGAKIAATVGIVAGIYKVLEPALKIVGAIGDMIAMFLRPISDIIITLVSPIMMMLRPLLQVFNTLMMPFRQIAMEGLAASNQLIGSGMQEMLTGDAELGRGMMSEGMRGALNSAQLLMSGFTEILLRPLADLLGVGERFSDIMKNVQSNALEGIVRVNLLNDTFNLLSEEFGSSAKVFEDARRSVGTQISELQKQFDEFDTENYEEVMATAKGTLEGIVGIISGDEKSVSKAAEDAGSTVEEFVGTFSSGIESMSGKVRELANSIAGFNFSVAAQSDLDEVTRNIQEAVPTWSDKFKETWNVTKKQISDAFEVGPTLGVLNVLGTPGSMFRNWQEGSEQAMTQWEYDSINSLVKWKDKWVPMLDDAMLQGMLHSNEHLKHFLTDSVIPDGFKSGLEHIYDYVKDYMGNDKIPNAFEKGLVHIYNDTNTYIGEQGRITTNFNKGMTTMDASTNKFGSSLNKVSGLLDDATRRMESYAKSYASAVRRIQSLESSLRNARSVVR